MIFSIGRVQGANFCAIYGGTSAVAWKNIKLPEGHSWKSFVEFLLATLPEESRKTYQAKFTTSINFWKNTGGVIANETISELKKMAICILKNDHQCQYMRFSLTKEEMRRRDEAIAQYELL